MKFNADKFMHVKPHDFKVHDRVLFRWHTTNKQMSRLDTDPYEITAINGTMITAVNNRHEVVRNSSCFQKFIGKCVLSSTPPTSKPTSTPPTMTFPLNIPRQIAPELPVTPPQTPAVEDQVFNLPPIDIQADAPTSEHESFASVEEELSQHESLNQETNGNDSQSHSSNETSLKTTKATAKPKLRPKNRTLSGLNGAYWSESSRQPSQSGTRKRTRTKSIILNGASIPK